jgi:predicted kinase
MPKLTLVRGLPGSGKSTFSLQKVSEFPELVHLEADQFFMRDGKYDFRTDLLHIAHQWCYSNTALALLDGYDVIVSNTFISIRELKKYIKLKEIIEDLKIEIVEMKTQYNSIHDVPEEKLELMKCRWQELPDQILD